MKALLQAAFHHHFRQQFPSLGEAELQEKVKWICEEFFICALHPTIQNRLLGESGIPLSKEYHIGVVLEEVRKKCRFSLLFPPIILLFRSSIRLKNVLKTFPLLLLPFFHPSITQTEKRFPTVRRFCSMTIPPTSMPREVGKVPSLSSSTIGQVCEDGCGVVRCRKCGASLPEVVWTGRAGFGWSSSTNLLQNSLPPMRIMTVPIMPRCMVHRNLPRDVC